LDVYNKIKRVAALILFAAFFLPLSQCTVKESITTDESAGIASSSSAVVASTVLPSPKEERKVQYAYSAYTFSEAGAFATYIAFLWPSLLELAALFFPGLKRSWRIAMFEMVFCLGSAYMVFTLTMFGVLMYGGYLAWGAICSYFLTTFVELYMRIRQAQSMTIERVSL
jgi:hypothetical protein